MSQRLVICNNRRLTAQKPSCGEANMAIATRLEMLTQELQIPISIEYKKCLSQCDKGPNMRLAPSGQFFHGVTLDSVPAIIEEIKRFTNKDEVSV